MEYKSWLNSEIEKKSGKPFKSGLKIGTPLQMTVNSYTFKVAFLMDDDSVVDCTQCKLKND